MDNKITYQIGWQDYKLPDSYQYKKPSWRKVAEDCAEHYVEKIKWAMCPKPMLIGVYHNGSFEGNFSLSTVVECNFIASKAR